MLSLGTTRLFVASGNQVAAYDTTTPCPPWAPQLPSEPACDAEWRFSPGRAVTPVVVGDNETVYVGTAAADGSGGQLLALRAGAGGARWQSQGIGPVTQPPALANGTLYADGDRNLVRMQADGCGRSECPNLFMGQLSADATVQPVVAGGVVYVGTADGTVSAFATSGCANDPSCGPIWSANAGAPVSGAWRSTAASSTSAPGTASSSPTGSRRPDRPLSSARSRTRSEIDGIRPRFRFVQREAFLTVRTTDDPHRWTLGVVPDLCTGGGFLFGGCGLGACIEALERTTDRPLIWATGQYLSYARPPSTLDIDVAIPVAGRSVTQARATAHVGDTEILTVNAALGRRPFDVEGTFATMPDVPAPDDCPGRKPRSDLPSVHTHLEQRLALGTAIDFDDTTSAVPPMPGGRSALWVRIADMPETTAAKLGVLGDYVAFGTAQAFGLPIGGNSLDNTLRVVSLAPTDWVLIEVQFQALSHGFGHGQVMLWAEDGTLLGIASQSTISRRWRDA